MRNKPSKLTNGAYINDNEIGSRSSDYGKKDYFVSIIDRNLNLIKLAILAVGVFVRFAYLWEGDLLWDDITFAHVADGLKDDPLHPKILGTTDVIGGLGTPGKYFELPPMTLWLIAISFRLLGVSSFTARLPVAILGSMAIWLIGILVKEISPDRRLGEYASIIAMALFSIERFLFEYSRRALHEIPLITWQILTLIFFIRAIKYKSKSNRNAIISGFFLGVGFLTKYHAVFGIVPFLLYFGAKQYITENNKKQLLGQMSKIYALILLFFILTAGSWLLNIYLWEPTSLSWLLNWLVDHTTGLPYFNPDHRPVYFYFERILSHTRVIFFLVLSLHYYEKKWFKLSLTWFIPVFLFLTYSEARHDWFTVSLIPPLIMLAAFGIAEDLIDQGGKRIFFPGLVLLSIRFVIYGPVSNFVKVTTIGILLCLPFFTKLQLSSIFNFKILARIRKISWGSTLSILLILFIFTGTLLQLVVKKDEYYLDKPGLSDTGLYIRDNYPNSKIYVEDIYININIRFFFGHNSGIKMIITPLVDIHQENVLFITYSIKISQFSSTFTYNILYLSGDYVFLQIDGILVS